MIKRDEAFELLKKYKSKGSGLGNELIDFVNRFSRRNCK